MHFTKHVFCNSFQVVLGVSVIRGVLSSNAVGIVAFVSDVPDCGEPNTAETHGNPPQLHNINME